MSKCVFLVQGDGALVEMVEQQYASEDILQQLIAKYPNILAGENGAVAGARRWLLITREATIASDNLSSGRWSLNHLFVDLEGVPPLLEVKRSTDSRIRREVIGQMMDYAANAILHWPIESIRLMYEEQCQAENLKPESRLQEFLGGAADTEAFWRTVKTNLQAGRIRLVFLADQIPPELRRVIEFLNSQMDPAEVLGIELKQYVGRDVTTLVPSFVGQTAEAETRKSQPRARRKWDEASFMTELAGKTDAVTMRTAETIQNWIRPLVSRIWFGEGERSGSFFPVLEKGGVTHLLFSVWTYGSIEICFQHFRPPFETVEMRKELSNRLNQIPTVKISGAMLSRRPTIQLAVLKENRSLETFIAAFEWMIAEIKRQ